jgi:carbon-monoxide dehydrogenase large subunit
LLIGSQSTGQGHATSYAQLVAERLDLPPERVRVIQGDTDRIKSGAGTGGSSSIPVGGVSVDRASKKLAEQLKEIAADALEASPRDLEIMDGSVRVAGTDRIISLPISPHQSASPEKLRAAEEFSVEPPTYPNGCHICELEIDRETGKVDITRYSVVDDFGTVLNPLLLHGQVHGGIAQGAGQALMEDIHFDGAGQLVTASFMDYAMPHAHDLCEIEVESNPVPTKTNPLGVKGAGEAGCVGSLPAVTNALVDALSEFGVKHIEMPATPERTGRPCAGSAQVLYWVVIGFPAPYCVPAQEIFMRNVGRVCRAGLVKPRYDDHQPVRLPHDWTRCRHRRRLPASRSGRLRFGGGGTRGAN